MRNQWALRVFRVPLGFGGYVCVFTWGWQRGERIVALVALWNILAQIFVNVFELNSFMADPEGEDWRRVGVRPWWSRGMTIDSVTITISVGVHSVAEYYTSTLIHHYIYRTNMNHSALRLSWQPDSSNIYIHRALVSGIKNYENFTFVCLKNKKENYLSSIEILKTNI